MTIHGVGELRKRPHFEQLVIPRHNAVEYFLTGSSGRCTADTKNPARPEYTAAP